VAGYDVFVYSRGLDTFGRADTIRAIGATPMVAETVTLEGLAAAAPNIDVIYEAAGASKLAFDAIGVLGVNGIFVFTGVPGRKGPVEVDTDRVMRSLVLRNQVLLGTVNAGRDAYEAAIRDLGEFVRRWPAATRSLVTGQFTMEESVDVLTGKVGGIKSVIRIV